VAETLEELQSQRAALAKALHTGAFQVRRGDKQVTYRSVEEIKKALAALDEAIALVSGKRRSRVTYVNAQRGY
jgi:hypothetical protein